MDLQPIELAAAVVTGPAVGFLAKWSWDRFWRKTDSAKEATEKARQLREQEREAKMHTLANEVAAVVRRQDVAEVRESERAKHLGVLETNQNRLDGKVDGLQTFWRNEFNKLGEQFKTFEDKIEYRLDNFRLELRGDSQKTEDRLTELLTAHQQRVHDRLNVIAADQARLLTEFVDKLVDKKAGDDEPTR